MQYYLKQVCLFKLKKKVYQFVLLNNQISLQRVVCHCNKIPATIDQNPESSFCCCNFARAKKIPLFSKMKELQIKWFFRQRTPQQGGTPTLSQWNISYNRTTVISTNKTLNNIDFFCFNILIFTEVQRYIGTLNQYQWHPTKIHVF